MNREDLPEYIEFNDEDLDIITRKMLEIETDIYGYQDKYYGRIPRLLHEIPEAGIYECNPEYGGLIYEILNGEINEDNISDELMNQMILDIAKMFRLDLIETYDEKMTMTCLGLGPTGEMKCSDEYECSNPEEGNTGDVFICDYKPFNKYHEFPPSKIYDLSASDNIVGYVRLNWSLPKFGTQPIYFDLYINDELFLTDVEPPLKVKLPYGPYIFKLKVYNTANEYFTDDVAGISAVHPDAGYDCCTSDLPMCIDFYSSQVDDPNFSCRFYTTDGPLVVSSYFGVCPQIQDKDMPDDCRPTPCEGDLCPDCVELDVWNPNYEMFTSFYLNDGRKMMLSSVEGSCGNGDECKFGLVCDDEIVDDYNQFTVYDTSIGQRADFITSDGYNYMVDVDCPNCIDYMVYDDMNDTCVNFKANGRWFVVSRKYESCDGYNRPLKGPIFGYNCDCQMCGNCLVLNTYEEDGRFYDFVEAGGKKYNVGMEYGGCGKLDPEPGYTCLPGINCPNCVTLKHANEENDNFGNFFLSDHGEFMVGWEECGCACQEPDESDYGYTCDVDLDCPDCVRLMPRSGYDSSNNPEFEEFIVLEGTMFISVVKDGCTGISVPPSEILNFTATDNEEGRVILDWDRPIYGNPITSYDIYRDGGLIASVTDIYYIDEVMSGSYEYYIKAVNSEGTSISETITGTSLDTGNMPNAPYNFEASKNLEGQIGITFEESTSGNPTPTYELHIGNGEVIQNVTSGYVHTIEPGEYDMYVLAVNSEGSAESNHDTGISLDIMEAFYTVSAKAFQLYGPDEYLRVKQKTV